MTTSERMLRDFASAYAIAMCIFEETVMKTWEGADFESDFHKHLVLARQFTRSALYGNTLYTLVSSVRSENERKLDVLMYISTFYVAIIVILHYCFALEKVTFSEDREVDMSPEFFAVGITPISAYILFAMTDCVSIDKSPQKGASES